MSFGNSSDSSPDTARFFAGGVNLLSQSFNTVGGTPFIAESAKGAYITDVQGNSYLDLSNSGGRFMLGYQHPLILKAVQEQAAKLTATSTLGNPETELAAVIHDIFPFAEKTRLISNRATAVTTAVRLARTATQREKVLRFEGCLHGGPDFLMKKGPNEKQPFDSPAFPGIPEAAVRDMLIAPYNSLEETEDLFKQWSGQIAAVVVEPVATEMGCVLPENSFIENLEKCCREQGSILILDETATAFRIPSFETAGENHASESLHILGGALGGGQPLFALTGPARLMNLLEPYGNVRQPEGGDLNLMAVTAGVATLNFLKNNPEVISNLNKTAETLDFEIAKILNKKNIPHRINRKGSLMSLFFHVDHVSSYKEALNANFSLYNSFFHHLLQQGVFLPPNALGTWYVSESWTDEDVRKVLQAAENFQYS